MRARTLRVDRTRDLGEARSVEPPYFRGDFVVRAGVLDQCIPESQFAESATVDRCRVEVADTTRPGRSKRGLSSRFVDDIEHVAEGCSPKPSGPRGT